MARGSERPKRLTEVEIHPAAGDKLPALLQVGETAATGFAVTDDSGKTVESVTLRIGETKHLNIAVLPSAADQSYTATVSNTSISTVKKGN